jgi:hypothetical protein
MTEIGVEVAKVGLASIVKAMADRLFTPAKRRPSGLSPEGKWHVTWRVGQPQDYRPKKVDDIVTLKLARNGKLKGSGENPFYGPYTLMGTDTPYAITLAYRGSGSKSNFPGVCLIIKTADPDRMDGVWWQYGSNGSFVGGTQGMKRIN